MTIKARSLMSAIEGYYATLIIDALHREGVLEVMAQPTPVADVAIQLGLDANVLACILEFAAIHCDVVVEDPGTGTFSVSESYASSRMPAHLLDQYVGAYGGCLNDLGRVFRDPAAGTGLVDRERHAWAFAQVGAEPNELIGLLLELKVKVVLEVGCGSGGLLLKLAESNPLLEAIGIDQNEDMLNRARLTASRQVDERIAWIHGDFLEVIDDLDDNVRDSVDVIVAQSVANEFFAQHSIESFLGGLSQAFPNRLLFLGDYYACLGGPPDGRVSGLRNASELRRAILHDVAQAVSGQGVPPRSLDAWQAHYAHSGCTLIHASEATSGGICRFLHIVQLEGEPNALHIGNHQDR